THAANTLFVPAIAGRRRLAAAIEEACNLPVRHQPGQLANEGYRILKHRPMLPASRIQSQLELQRSVVSALPVQDQVDDRAFLSHDDLADPAAQDPLPFPTFPSPLRPAR